MQVSVTLTDKDVKIISRTLNRGADAFIVVARLVMLFVALAPAVVTPLLHWRDTAPAEILAAIFSYPLLYAGLLLFVLFSRPVLKLLGYDSKKRIGGLVLNTEEQHYQVDAQGLLRSQNGRVVARYAPTAISEVLRKKGYLLVLQGNTLLGAMPDRCFASLPDALAADNQLRQAVAYSRGGYAAPFAIAPEDCIWRFQYVFDTTLGVAVNNMLRSSKLAGRYTKMAGWVILLVFVVLLLPGAIVALWLVDANFFSVMWLLLLWGFALPAVLSRNPKKLAKPGLVPGYQYGPTTLEIRQDGVRVYNPQYEELYTWPQLSGTLPGQSVSLVLRRAGAVAAIPYNVAPPEVVQQALAHVEQNALLRK